MFEVASSEDEDAVEAVGAVRTERSAWAFTFGAERLFLRGEFR